jgi:hypothetical protein
MTTRQKLRVAILKSLLAADETPLPESVLIETALQLVQKDPTKAEAETARQELESEGYITGARGFTGREWVLTTKGKLQAQQL